MAFMKLLKTLRFQKKLNLKYKLKVNFARFASIDGCYTRDMVDKTSFIQDYCQETIKL